MNYASATDCYVGFLQAIAWLCCITFHEECHDLDVYNFVNLAW